MSFLVFLSPIRENFAEICKEAGSRELERKVQARNLGRM